MYLIRFRCKITRSNWFQDRFTSQCLWWPTPPWAIHGFDELNVWSFSYLLGKLTFGRCTFELHWSTCTLLLYFMFLAAKSFTVCIWSLAKEWAPGSLESCPVVARAPTLEGWWALSLGWQWALGHRRPWQPAGDSGVGGPHLFPEPLPCHPGTGCWPLCISLSI